MSKKGSLLRFSTFTHVKLHISTLYFRYKYFVLLLGGLLIVSGVCVISLGESDREVKVEDEGTEQRGEEDVAEDGHIFLSNLPIVGNNLSTRNATQGVYAALPTLNDDSYHSLPLSTDDTYTTDTNTETIVIDLSDNYLPAVPLKSS